MGEETGVGNVAPVLAGVHWPRLSAVGIPAPLTWDVAPVSASLDDAQTLHITADGETDLFCDPQGQVNKYNSPRLLFQPDRQFTLSARVAVDFAATFDAGVLMIYADDTSWAKLCFELSPQGQPMVVTVVTNGRSDDCNSTVIEQAVFLRISGLGTAFAFHYSLDGQHWHFVRYFALQKVEGARIGFSSQAPVGSGCTAHFSDIRYTPSCIADIRSGD